mmetsp:Transcript_19530/g.53467  ORF Transcript_19530/g.53467 Transcript_19530/m.53467 type:complete len:272 (-) Transcript_19530:368-1183(-)
MRSLDASAELLPLGFRWDAIVPSSIRVAFLNLLHCLPLLVQLHLVLQLFILGKPQDPRQARAIADRVDGVVSAERVLGFREARPPHPAPAKWHSPHRAPGALVALARRRSRCPGLLKLPLLHPRPVLDGVLVHAHGSSPQVNAGDVLESLAGRAHRFLQEQARAVGVFRQLCEMRLFQEGPLCEEVVWYPHVGPQALRVYRNFVQELADLVHPRASTQGGDGPADQASKNLFLATDFRAIEGALHFVRIRAGREHLVLELGYVIEVGGCRS